MKACYFTHWGKVEINGDKASICELMNYLDDAADQQKDKYGCLFTAKHIREIRKQIADYYEEVKE